MTIYLIIAGIIVLIGILALKRAVDRAPGLSPKQAAEIIEKFIEGKSDGPYDWDDFICVTHKNPKLEEISQKCNETREKFPPDKKGEWCNAKGLVELKRLAEEARKLDENGKDAKTI